MRTIAVILVGVSLSCPVLAQPTEGPQRAVSEQVSPWTQDQSHHQPSQAEIEQRRGAKTGAARATAGRTEGADDRFLAACATRMDLDLPLDSERTHSAFCTCWLGALRRSTNAVGVALVADSLEKRNGSAPVIPALPTDVDRSNEASISSCMPELAR